MAAGQGNRMMHQLRWLAHGCAERAERAERARSDGQLLERFISRQDEHAFEELLRRHGPMVLGVCRRLLGHAQDAEDAFQATFMVLVRRARAVQPRELVGNWLYGVACRVALDAQARSNRRRGREKQVEDMPHPTTPPADVDPDLRPLLDRELSRLPEKYRVAIVLCDLEGRPRKDVARQLGVPEGTLSSRLNAGRKMLAGRLARHGLALSGAAVASALAAGPTQAAIPGTLAISTIKAAAVGAARPAAALGFISARAAALTEGVMKAMLISKLKTMAGLLLTAGLFACGAGAMTLTADEPPAGGAKAQAKSAVPAVGAGQVVGDVDDDVFVLAGGKLVPLRQTTRLTREQQLYKNDIEQAIGQWIGDAKQPEGHPDDWSEILRDVHRSPKWANRCTVCHQAHMHENVKPPAKQLPQAKGGSRGDAGTIIVIRLPKQSNPESDAQFLRRVCLDVLGRTPTPLEMHYFLADKSAYKYRAAVEQLARQSAAPDSAAKSFLGLPKQVTVRHAEAYVREKLGKQQLSPAEQQVVERVVEFMQKQP
jgi:RNA polymerase sigma factor (sigma-70 family)